MGTHDSLGTLSQRKRSSHAGDGVDSTKRGGQFRTGLIFTNRPLDVNSATAVINSCWCIFLCLNRKDNQGRAGVRGPGHSPCQCSYLEGEFRGLPMSPSGPGRACAVQLRKQVGKCGYRERLGCGRGRWRWPLVSRGSWLWDRRRLHRVPILLVLLLWSFRVCGWGPLSPSQAPG